MADFPNTIYAPRAKENRSGVVYDPDKKTVGFVEDITYLEAEVIALETFLRIPTSIPANPVAGSAYFTTADNTLHVYNGTAWKTTVLS
jgi:hypothetical protein